MAKFGLSDVIYNGKNLSELLGTKILNYSTLEFPSRSTTSSRVAMAHRSTTSRYFTSKQIDIVFITEPLDSEQTDMNWLESVVARLRVLSQTRWYDLTLVAGILENSAGDWAFGDETVTWKETRIENFRIRQIGRQAEITLTFISDEPIGIGGTTQTLFSEAGITDAIKIFDLSEIDLQGTFYLQYPHYEITINSVDLGAEPSLTLSNGFANLTYTQPIYAGDVLVLDCQAVSVQRNGNLVDFDGALPVIERGLTNVLTVSHTYDALDYDITIINQPGYI